MKSLIILILAVFFLSGCGGKPESVEISIENIKTTCLNGVTYYHYAERKGYGGYGFMSPAYNPDGSLILCKSNLISNSNER